MTRIRKLLQRKPGIPECAAFAAAFLLLTYLLVYHNTLPWQLWLPMGENNDEIIYNRQVVSVLNGGIKGYFGFNEQHAQLGGYAAWGPLVIWLYAIPGLLLAKGVNLLFWANLLFFVAGWVVFSCAAQLRLGQQLTLAVMTAAAWLPLRQVFTGASEPLHYFLFFCIIGGAVGSVRHRGWYILSLAACVLETIIKPYGAVLFLFPLAMQWRQSRRRSAVCAVGAVAAFGLSMVSSKLFNAPYFYDIFDLTAFKLMAAGNIRGGLAYLAQYFCGTVQQLLNSYIQPMLRGEATGFNANVAHGALRIAVLFVLVLILCVVDGVRRRPMLGKLCTLVSAGLIVLAILGTYTAEQFGRYSTMICMLLLIPCVLEDSLTVLAGLPALVLLLFVGGGVEYTSLPARNEGLAAQMQTAADALAERMAQTDSSDPWEYTIAYAYADGVWDGCLYAVPAGMGIEFDFSTYLADSANEVLSKYAMVGHDTPAAQRLLTDGWQVLVETESFVIYERT